MSKLSIRTRHEVSFTPCTARLYRNQMKDLPHHEAQEEHEGRKDFLYGSISSVLSDLGVLPDLRGGKVTWWISE